MRNFYDRGEGGKGGKGGWGNVLFENVLLLGVVIFATNLPGRLDRSEGVKDSRGSIPRHGNPQG